MLIRGSRRDARIVSSNVIRLSAAFLVILAILMSGTPVFSVVSIKLKDKVEVLGPRVLLGDVAEFPEGLVDELEDVQSLVLCFAPRPGLERKLSRLLIEGRIKSAFHGKMKFTITGANQVKIRVASKTVSGEDIAEVAVSFVKSVVPYDDADREITVLSVPKDCVMPARDARIAVIARGYANLKKTKLISVGLYNGETLYERVSVPVHIRTFEQVIVAQQPIPMNTIIDSDDVKLCREETSDYLQKIVKDIGEAIGKRAKMSIQRGTILSSRMLDEPPLIRRGDMVTLRASFGTVLIETRVEAREDGRRGDLIHVFNKSSRKRLMAEVLSNDTVIISSDKNSIK